MSGWSIASVPISRLDDADIPRVIASVEHTYSVDKPSLLQAWIELRDVAKTAVVAPVSGSCVVNTLNLFVQHPPRLQILFVDEGSADPSEVD